MAIVTKSSGQKGNISIETLAIPIYDNISTYNPNFI